MSPAAEAALASMPAADDPAFEKYRRRTMNPVLLSLFMLTKFPLAFVAGLRLRSLSPERCEVSVPYGWRTTNPFRSTYFAALAMAAELATGALAMAAVKLSPASMALLIVGLEAEFVKKATAKTTFTCEAGDAFFAAARKTVATGEPVQVRAETVGRLPDGTEVARFAFTWSLKRRG